MLKYFLFIFTANRNVNIYKDILCSYKILIVKTTHKNKKFAKEQLLLVLFFYCCVYLLYIYQNLYFVVTFVSKYVSLIFNSEEKC